MTWLEPVDSDVPKFLQVLCCRLFATGSKRMDHISNLDQTLVIELQHLLNLYMHELKSAFDFVTSSKLYLYGVTYK